MDALPLSPTLANELQRHRSNHPFEKEMRSIPHELIPLRSKPYRENQLNPRFTISCDFMSTKRKVTAYHHKRRTNKHKLVRRQAYKCTKPVCSKEI